MPLYEYHCQDCEQQVSIRRRFSDTSSPRCPICGGDNLSRTMSSAFVVKSQRTRTRDLSWVDRALARRVRRASSGKLSPEVEEAMNWLESR
jgi:putative FmdB family regulatory protein